MKKKLKIKKIYFVFLIITLVFFGIFVKMDFATDTYAVLESSRRGILQNFLQSGRLITAFFFSAFVVLKTPISIVYLLTFLAAIFSISFSMYKLYYIIKENIVDNKYISAILAVSIIINPFSIELFMFIEKGVMTFGVLACVLALEQFVKFVENCRKKESYKFEEGKSRNADSLEEINKKIKKEFCLAIFYMSLAVFSYQGVVAIFLALATVFVLKNSKTFVEFLKETIASVMIYLIPAILNFVMVRLIFRGSRVNGERVLAESLKRIINGIANMFVTYSILPREFFIALFYASLIIFAVTIFTNKNIKHKSLKILELLYLDFITIFATVAPQILQSTNSIWFVSRSTYAFASIIGINSLFILIVVLEERENKTKTKLEKNTTELRELETNAQELELRKSKIEPKDNKTKYIKNIEIAVEILNLVLIFATWYRFNLIEIAHYNLNYEDKLIAEEIGKEIYNYEQETGIEVKKVAVYKDKNPRYTYPNIFVTGDINISAFGTEWSDVNSINYYNNLKLERIEQDEEKIKEFANEDWESFDKEQLIFEGDTLHLCVF